MRRLTRVAGSVLLAVLLSALLAVSGTTARAAVRRGADAGAWSLHGWVTRAADYTDQGLATVTDAQGRPRLVTRGDDSIPRSLFTLGWRHVGDPGGYGGYLLDAYQAHQGAAAKLFVLTTPAGRTYRLVHRLLPGEGYNNSFATVAPGGRWFVAGEWGTMRRLLVFGLPPLRTLAGSPGTRPLPLAAVISLDRPVRNVQGCAFSSATTLNCSTNDPSRTLFGVPQQLLTIRLAHLVTGAGDTGSVRLLAGLPRVGPCGRSQEVEGIDVYGGRMLVSVVSACVGTTTTLDYRLESVALG